MEGIIMTVQLLLGLSLLVGLHELGHLVAAKAFGMRVEKYSIGFPPKIWGKKFGETEYSIGAIPLGGFVKISGMIDESMDIKSLSSEPEPYEFRAKPAWQRLVVMMGGIVVNVITGIVIFIAIVYSQGETYIPREEVNKHGIVAYELGKKLGFETGDKVVNVNGKQYDKFTDLTSGDVLLSTDGYYTAIREGEEVKISIPNNFIDEFSDQDAQRPFIFVRTPFVVGPVTPGSNAEAAGLQKGDIIKSVNGQGVTYFDEFQEILQQNAGGQAQATIIRDGQQEELTFDVTDEGTIGFAADFQINYETVDYGIGESIAKGTTEAFQVVWVNIRAFQKMFAGEVSATKNLSGPIGIAKIFGGQWDWLRFWRITGLLSMILAFMNFLPIPALDGGHVMFLSWEMITGRKPSDKFLENAQKVGMILLLGIMTFAIFNDISKFF